MSSAVLATAFVSAAAGVAAAAPEGGGAWKAARGVPGGKSGAIVRVRALDAKAGTIELQYAMPGLKAVKAKGASKTTGVEEEVSQLQLGNAPSIGDPGKPLLPVVPCYVVLPAGQTLGTVEVVPGNAMALPGRHVVPHGRKAVPLVPGAKAEPTPRDPAVYGSDEPWPKDKLTVIGVQKKRGVSVLIVNLHPVVYRPKSGQVSYYPAMTLKVTSKPAAAKAGRDRYAVRYRPDKIRPLSRQVDNPATLTTYGEGK
jgi:hypothetical protein